MLQIARVNGIRPQTVTNESVWEFRYENMLVNNETKFISTSQMKISFSSCFRSQEQTGHVRGCG